MPDRPKSDARQFIQASPVVHVADVRRAAWVALSCVACLLPAACARDPYHIPGQDPDARVAEPPPIRGDELADFPDPAHVRLKDGRVYRLAGFEDVPPTDPEFVWRRNRLWSFTKRAADRGRPLGLLPVGRSDEGEERVEFWSYPEPLLVCGNTTEAERRQILRHWYSIQDEALFQVERRQTGRYAR